MAGAARMTTTIRIRTIKARDYLSVNVGSPCIL
jgi:hypothetical protein